MNKFIHAFLELIGLEIVEVLPPPDRSCMRQMELFDAMDKYRKKLDREN